MTARNVKWLWVFLALCWTSLLHAAESTPPFDPFEGYSGKYLLLCLGAILAGGTASILAKLSAELEKEGGKVRYPKLFVASNLMGSVLAGFIMFGYGTHSEWKPMLLVVGIAIISFAGAKGVEMLGNAFYAKIPGGSALMSPPVLPVPPPPDESH